MELRAMNQACSAKPSLIGLYEMDERRALILALAKREKNLTPAEVRQLRRALFEEEGVSREEAAALFELDRAQNAACLEWTEFFVECLTDHVVWQARPTGVIAHEQAQWLIDEADKQFSLSGFALLANVLAEAHRAPQWFLDAVRLRARAPEVQAALAATAMSGEAATA
jgi:hypothetical protein